MIDGDAAALANGARVRLIQIDSPELYYGVCTAAELGCQASAETNPSHAAHSQGL